MSAVQEAFGKAIFWYAEVVRDYVSRKLKVQYGSGQAWFEAFVE